MSGLVTVRPFALGDLEASARFAEAVRALDPAVEAFGQRLGLIATGPRAVLDVWRVAAGEDGGVYGLAFAAVRESQRGAVCDFYAAVHPSLRRQGLGRALSEPAVASSAALRARVRDDALPGRAFLAALGFTPTGAQLSLQWSGDPPEPPPLPALRIRRAGRRDEAALKTLSDESWDGAPEAFHSRADEIAQGSGGVAALPSDGRRPLAARARAGNAAGRGVVGGRIERARAGAVPLRRLPPDRPPVADGAPPPVSGRAQFARAAGGADLGRATRTRRTRRSSRCTTVSSRPPM